MAKADKLDLYKEHKADYVASKKTPFWSKFRQLLIWQ